jgi:hypothetical protein
VVAGQIVDQVIVAPVRHVVVVPHADDLADSPSFPAIGASEQRAVR